MSRHLILTLSVLSCLVLSGCAEGTSESSDGTTTTTQEETSAISEETSTAHEETHAAHEETSASTDTAADNDVAVTETEKKEMSGPLSFEMETLAGEKVALSKYDGNVVLFVNVASQCGLTPQYEKLQALHAKYGGKGLSVVGVPCNQFGGQEPGSADEIQEFCSKNYGVEFDMMAKVDVNGDGACDLYKYLTALETEPQGSGNIGWNFEKFLVDRSGKVINRFSPRVSPDDSEIITAIETALATTP